MKYSPPQKLLDQDKNLFQIIAIYQGKYLVKLSVNPKQSTEWYTEEELEKKGFVPYEETRKS